VASAALGAGLYAVHPDPVPAAAAFLAGTLIDLDHLLDLKLYQKHRKEGEGLAEVFDAHTWVKSYILLHGIEFIPLLLLALFFAQNTWLWIGIASGYVLHLVMDLVGNRGYPLTYFLTYRIFRGFDARYLWTDSRPNE
jgi:hypothetical protein